MIPSVSIITPTTPDRSIWASRLDQMVSNQDYPNIIQHCLIDGNDTIGAKRNRGCFETKGDIIVMMDDDDIYADNYVSLAVAALENTDNLGGFDIAGLSSAYFYHMGTKQAYRYDWKGSQPYIIESGMAFRRSTWQKRQFPRKSDGEGIIFQLGRRVGCINALYSFIATIHGTNISSHKNLHTMELLPFGYLNELPIFEYLKT